MRERGGAHGVGACEHADTRTGCSDAHAEHAHLPQPLGSPPKVCALSAGRARRRCDKSATAGAAGASRCAHEPRGALAGRHGGAQACSLLPQPPALKPLCHAAGQQIGAQARLADSGGRDLLSPRRARQLNLPPCWVHESGHACERCQRRRVCPPCTQLRGHCSCWVRQQVGLLPPRMRLGGSAAGC